MLDIGRVPVLNDPPDGWGSGFPFNLGDRFGGWRRKYDPYADDEFMAADFN
jgi:hypothetical protein